MLAVQDDRDERGAEIGRGLVGYGASEAVLIAGRNSQDILRLLGSPGRAAIIHRDDMALARDRITAREPLTDGKP